jgi:hypothetical protein
VNLGSVSPSKGTTDSINALIVGIDRSDQSQLAAR